ncbi:phosphoribosylanthranilate isomerase [Bacillus pakistanensis]|uniref:N-(5'-phosphoribosyl)anthranilate isomerase n=1 Tax=Rossellomorea pakistanensis TaxID=992288 RepID=A0ABS2N8H4_9BACI|nr:phosphoribosylanthranilate isomerase [Bacillus pakistanensis]MBM7584165.1 phosphoribosylanthranilate isomerase [Bacillus pakistanensis]
MTHVKVCGIREYEHAIAAADAGVDALGFVFAESKRKVSLKQAQSISKRLPDHVKKIGVFVNASREELAESYEFAGLDFVQLHGNESPLFCEQLNLPFIKAFRIKGEDDIDRIKEFENASYYLLDSASGPYQGGNGTQFNWEFLNEKEVDHNKLILAGGLNQDNLQKAIEIVQPTMVDVSSGVETNGIKDIHKIKRFIGLAKQF